MTIKATSTQAHPCARKMTDNPGVSRHRHSVAAAELGVIVEGDTESDEEEFENAEESEEQFLFDANKQSSLPSPPPNSPLASLADELEACDVLQAFSCWTYKVASRRRCLVCDLQGTFVNDANGSGRCRLTDPVTHTSAMAEAELREKFRSMDNKRERFGRTDRGQQGIDDFFRTHQCSKLCRMLGSRRLRHFHKPRFQLQDVTVRCNEAPPGLEKAPHHEACKPLRSTFRGRRATSIKVTAA